MSAALKLPFVWGSASVPACRPAASPKPQQKCAPGPGLAPDPGVAEPDASLAFYRKHTESMLRRYLYASMQGEFSVGLRDWV